MAVERQNKPTVHILAEGFENWMSAEPSRILDMCTGSGCLAILSAMAYPQSHVDAVDISADALTLASFNIGKHGLEDRVRLVQSDGLAQIPEGLQYDLIVCNPPYVDAGEMAATLTFPLPDLRRLILGIVAHDVPSRC